MYSLDQVIYFLEQRQKTEDWNIMDAAIAYLKGYRDVLPEYAQMKLDAVTNEPLTWDELKGMEGKPVWIDAESLPVGVSPYWKDWYIIKSFSNDEFMYCNDSFELAKEMQGRLWQAYLKERE